MAAPPDAPVPELVDFYDGAQIFAVSEFLAFKDAVVLRAALRGQRDFFATFEWPQFRSAEPANFANYYNYYARLPKIYSGADLRRFVTCFKRAPCVELRRYRGDWEDEVPGTFADDDLVCCEGMTRVHMRLIDTLTNAAFEHLSNLRDISIWNCENIDSGCFVHLQRATSLSFCDAQTSFAIMSPDDFGFLHNVRHVTLNCLGLTDACIAKLKRAEGADSLSSLCVHAPNFTLDGPEAIGDGLTGDGFLALSHLVVLELRDFGYWTHSLAQGVGHIATLRINMQMGFYSSDQDHVDDNGVQLPPMTLVPGNMAPLTGVMNLELRDCLHLHGGALSQMPRLRTLTVVRHRFAGNELQPAPPALQELIVHDSMGLTPEFLATVPALHSVSIYHCDDVTASALTRLNTSQLLTFTLGCFNVFKTARDECLIHNFGHLQGPQINEYNDCAVWKAPEAAAVPAIDAAGAAAGAHEPAAAPALPAAAPAQPDADPDGGAVAAAAAAGAAGEAAEGAAAAAAAAPAGGSGVAWPRAGDKRPREDDDDGGESA